MIGLSGAAAGNLSGFCSTVLSGFILPISLPSLSLTVTVPSSATSIVAPSGNVLLPLPSLFASSTAFLTFSLSASDKAFELSTVIGSAGATIAPGFAFSLTVSDAGIVVSFPSFVTTTVPSSLTSICSSVKPVFAVLTASLTAVFSSGVNFDLFATSVIAGAFTSVDTVLSLPSVFGCSPSFVTVTLPSLYTAICSSVRPGFAFLTASLIACFSSFVKFVGSFTATFAGSFNSDPGVAF